MKHELILLMERAWDARCIISMRLPGDVAINLIRHLTFNDVGRQCLKRSFLSHVFNFETDHRISFEASEGYLSKTCIKVAYMQWTEVLGKVNCTNNWVIFVAPEFTQVAAGLRKFFAEVEVDKIDSFSYPCNVCVSSYLQRAELIAILARKVDECNMTFGWMVWSCSMEIKVLIVFVTNEDFFFTQVWRLSWTPVLSFSWTLFCFKSNEQEIKSTLNVLKGW